MKKYKVPMRVKEITGYYFIVEAEDERDAERKALAGGYHDMEEIDNSHGGIISFNRNDMEIEVVEDDGYESVHESHDDWM